MNRIPPDRSRSFSAGYLTLVVTAAVLTYLLLVMGGIV
jgi:hypothetical protein